MGIKDLLEGPHLVVLILVVVVLFGRQRLPEAARGLGRSMRIFKSEINEMKSDGKATSSTATRDTLKGEEVYPSPVPVDDLTLQRAGDPSEPEGLNKQPARAASAATSAPSASAQEPPSGPSTGAMSVGDSYMGEAACSQAKDHDRTDG
jgi:sec-independent protein translocase protein TatA